MLWADMYDKTGEELKEVRHIDMEIRSEFSF